MDDFIDKAEDILQKLTLTQDSIKAAAAFVHSNIQNLSLFTACWQAYLSRRDLEAENIRANIFACHEACLQDPPPRLVGAAFSFALPDVWSAILRNYPDTQLPDFLRQVTTKLWPECGILSHALPVLLSVLNDAPPGTVTLADPPKLPAESAGAQHTAQLAATYDAVSDLPRRCVHSSKHVVDLTSTVLSAPNAPVGSSYLDLLPLAESNCVEACREEHRVLKHAATVLEQHRDVLEKKMRDVASCEAELTRAAEPLVKARKTARALSGMGR